MALGIFYEDAANEVIDASYPEAAEESKARDRFHSGDQSNSDRKRQGIHLRGNRSC